jgi:LPXTG-motif cell wall-anchored protein
MDLRYTPKAGAGSTDVFVPRRHYPAGYDAVVTGGRVLSAPQSRHLLVASNGSAEVRVIVRPHVGGAPLLRPAPPTAPARSDLPATGNSAISTLLGVLILGIAALLLKAKRTLISRT